MGGLTIFLRRTIWRYGREMSLFSVRSSWRSASEMSLRWSGLPKPSVLSQSMVSGERPRAASGSRVEVLVFGRDFSAGGLFSVDLVLPVVGVPDLGVEPLPSAESLEVGVPMAGGAARPCPGWLAAGAVD